MKAIVLGILFLLLVVSAGGWFFRYEYLAPVTYQQSPTRENPTGRLLVVCKANRWTGHISCEIVIADLERNVEEMERWLKDRKNK